MQSFLCLAVACKKAVFLRNRWSIYFVLFVWFVSLLLFSASFDQPPEGEHERWFTL